MLSDHRVTWVVPPNVGIASLALAVVLVLVPIGLATVRLARDARTGNQRRSTQVVSAACYGFAGLVLAAVAVFFVFNTVRFANVVALTGSEIGLAVQTPIADPSGASAVTECPADPTKLTPTGASGARNQLVPFTPTAALLCGYTEFHPPYSAHPSRALAAGPTLRALTAAMNTAEDESARDVGSHSCPGAPGVTVNAYFWNANSRVEVYISTGGCAYESNGALSDASLPDSVSKLIAALVPPRIQVIGTPIR